MGDPQERDPQEWTKLLFDYYKHVATLSGVGIAILVTVYHQEIVDKHNVRLSLVLFGLGVLFCGVGMIRLLVFFPLSPGTGRATAFPLTAILATGWFVLGVAMVVLAPLEPPPWLVVGGLVWSVTLLLWLLSGRTIFGAGFPRNDDPR